MKKKMTAVLLIIALLAGCQSQVPAAPSAADAPDTEEIIRQEVDEAVRERLKEYEEEQRKKDQEIAELKKQLEEAGKQPEVPPAQNKGDTPVDRPSASMAPPESQPEPEASSSQGGTPPQEGLPPQPEPEPAPEKTSQPKAPGSSGGFDLKNLYPNYVWEGTPEEAPEPSYTAGCLLEEADEVIRLTNLERETHGLEPLAVDEELMELARVRAEELREKYSHTLPDGTNVGVYRCGENIGQRSSATEQVTSWMNSEGHRTNILLDRYYHIGAACYQAENGNLYWVQVFSLD